MIGCNREVEMFHTREQQHFMANLHDISEGNGVCKKCFREFNDRTKQYFLGSGIQEIEKEYDV